MKTETAGSPQPAEVLIPEARQHQRTRYRRRGAAVVIASLVVAALIVSAVLLIRGPAAGGKTGPTTHPVATASASSVVYFRPVLCYAAPYAAPAGSPGKATTTGTEPIPACAAASLLSPANLNVTPSKPAPELSSPQGYASNPTPIDQQYASYLSTSPHEPGYTSHTVLLPGAPGVKGACDGVTQVRCVLGPVEMSSRAIAKATAMRNQTGQWIVDYTTTSAGAALWDRVTQRSFHGFLGIELNGVVYSVPIIQPTQSSFSSFDGRGEISGNLNQAAATRLAKALTNHTG